MCYSEESLLLLRLWYELESELASALELERHALQDGEETLPRAA